MVHTHSNHAVSSDLSQKRGGNVPQRTLPPFLFWQVLAVGFVAGVAAYWFPILWFVVFLIPFLDSRTHHVLRGILLCLAVGMGWFSAWHIDNKPTDSLSEYLASGHALMTQAETVQGVVTRVAGLPEGRLRIVLDHLQYRDTGEKIRGRAVWTWQNPAFRPITGDTLTVKFKLRPQTAFRNGNSENYLTTRRLQNELWRAYTYGYEAHVRILKPSENILARWREQLRFKTEHFLKQHLSTPFFESATRSKQTPAWGIVLALLFGDRFFLVQSDLERISMAGLSHSIALSGQHLSVTVLFAFWFICVLSTFYPNMFLKQPRSLWVGYCALPLACMYWWIGGAPDSLTRATLMLVCWIVFNRLRRPSAFPDALLTALFLMVAWNPSCLLELGVQLSFLAVAGITLFSPHIGTLYLKERNKQQLSISLRFLRAFIGLCCCSLAAQLATLPLTTHVFGTTTVWSWMNVLWLPILGCVVLPLAFLGLIALVLQLTTAATLFFTVAVWPCEALVNVLAWLNSHGMTSFVVLRPHAASMLGVLILMASLAWALGRKVSVKQHIVVFFGAFLLFTGAALRVFEGFSAQVTLKVLDVGQGQAVLLELPYQRRILIDGGGFSFGNYDVGKRILLPTLTQNRPPRVEHIFVTHPDADHLFGLLSIAPLLQPKTFSLAKGFQTKKTLTPKLYMLLDTLKKQHTTIHTLERGEQYVFDQLTLDIVAPPQGGLKALGSARTDNDGLILRLARGQHGLVMIPGDAGVAAQNNTAVAVQALHSDVLIAPHHGSKNNISPTFINAVQPQWVLVSCAQYNRYLLPSDALKTLLTTQNIPFYTTGEHGALTVQWFRPFTDTIAVLKKSTTENVKTTYKAIIEQYKN